MSDLIQFRRGLNNQRSGIVFNNGEPAWATDTKEFFIGDGVTSGGVGMVSQNSNQIISGEKFFKKNVFIDSTLRIRNSGNIGECLFLNYYSIGNELSTTPLIDLSQNKLIEANGFDSIDWFNRTLLTNYLSSPVTTYDWQQGIFYNFTDSSVSMDYKNRFVSGAWQLVTSTPPTTATSNGIKGQIATSGNFLYICTGTNKWGKIAISAF